MILFILYVVQLHVGRDDDTYSATRFTMEFSTSSNASIFLAIHAVIGFIVSLRFRPATTTRFFKSLF